MTGPSAASPALYWKRLLAPFSRPHAGRALFQLISTALLYAGTWYLMLLSLQVSWWLTLALAVPASFLLVRLFIFQHDCGHGSFFRSRKANDAVGSLIGVLMLTPYAYWRRTHAIHHATSGNLDLRSFGDIETLTVDEYLALSSWGRLRYRMYRNLFVLLLLGPAYQFLVKHRFPFDIPRRWRREWASVFWTNLAIAALVVLACWTIGWQRFLLVQVPITLISGALGVWLFYIQHQFEDTYWRENPEWDFHRAGIEGSSLYDLPSWLHWFTGNIGYHHIHHLASRIPNYRLKQCFREVAELQHVTRLRILESLHCARLKLWDEQTGRLVRFRELSELRAT